MPMTLDEVRRAGLLALRERLGKAGMIRFLQQFETGAGNYAADRRRWVDDTTMAELRTLAAQPSSASPKRKRPKGRVDRS